MLGFNASSLGIERFTFSIDMFSRKIAAIERNIVEKEGITIQQRSAMSLIEKHGRITMRDLSALMNLSMSTVSKIIDNLVKRHYVIREHGTNDRRNVYSSLTNVGKEFLGVINAKINEQYSQVYNFFHKREREQIIQTLEKIHTSFNQLL